MQMYAAAMAWDMGERATQVVLQCKQNLAGIVPNFPQNYNARVRSQIETMGFKEARDAGTPALNGQPINDYTVCPNTQLFSWTSNIEILSNEPKSCVPYRLMLRTFEPEKPPNARHHPKGFETFSSPNDAEPSPAGKSREQGEKTLKWY